MHGPDIRLLEVWVGGGVVLRSRRREMYRLVWTLGQSGEHDEGGGPGFLGRRLRGSRVGCRLVRLNFGGYPVLRVGRYCLGRTRRLGIVRLVGGSLEGRLLGRHGRGGSLAFLVVWVGSDSGLCLR